MRLLFVCFAITLILPGAPQKKTPAKKPAAKAKTAAPKAAVTSAAAKTAAASSALPLHFPRTTPPEVRALMSRMSLREMAAQLVIVPWYGENPASTRKAFQDYARLVRDSGVGGIILLNRVANGAVQRAEPLQMAAFLNRMQRLAKLPLIVGGDFERGASMRVETPALFPHAMAFGAANDLAATRAFGSATAREARALGVHWVFAPVADVNNNPDNPIINTRSFGEDPRLVAAHVKAFIAGAHGVRQGASLANGVLLTVKHFPGHGDTATDTHLGLARIEGDRARLDQIELVPFQAAIEAGVDGVMMGHLAVPAIEEQEIPATISAKVIYTLLRKELGFEGLTVTDAMDMRGLTKQFPPGEAAVRALEAGAQVLLIPADPEAAIRGIVAAVQSGRLPATKVHSAAAALLTAKHRLGLFQQRFVALENIAEQIDAPELTDLAQSVAEKALAVVRDEARLLPLRDTKNPCVVALVEGRYSKSGKRLLDEVRLRNPNAGNWWLDATMKPAELEEAAAQMAGCDAIAVAAFVTVSSFRGNVALPGNFTPFVEALTQGNTPVILCALGSPYLLKSFPAAAAHVATFSTSPTSEAALVRGLWGEVPMRAKPPVSIF
jgi:beta-N-acetylhexosaminidase